MLRCCRIAGLVGCALVSLLGTSSAQITSDLPLLDTPFAPAGYARLLQEYVIQNPLPDGGMETRVDYARLASEPDLEKFCADLRKRFLSVNPLTLDPTTRRAWALNTYNFLIVDLVLDNLIGADGKPLESIADIGEGDFSVFDDEFFEVGGVDFSLNRFENHFLFHDVDRDSRHIPRELDPRFHFAMVCAATGCPSLWPEPFHPGILDDQLDEVTRNALQSPRQLRLEGRLVRVSKIFEWYRPDFKQHGGVEGFIRLYAPESVVREMNEKGSRVKVVPDIEWDWSLNRP